MPGIDPTQLVKDMEAAATGVIKQDVSSLRGFAAQQLNAIAQQAVFVAEGIADGSIAKGARDYFLTSLKEMARSFVNTLAGLVTVVIEQVWNAVVGVVWAAINKATGLSLVVP
jgi:hypothetical protein